MLEFLLGLSLIAIAVGYYLAFGEVLVFVLPLFTGIAWGYWRAMLVAGAGWLGVFISVGALQALPR